MSFAVYIDRYILEVKFRPNVRYLTLSTLDGDGLGLLITEMLQTFSIVCCYSFCRKVTV